MSLTAKDFPDFYRVANGYAPFPWQRRLVETVAAGGGRWPDVLDLPTSAGKTSALDAAVFLLALEAGKGVHEREAALRSFYVVDRRIVVDEAGMKARRLADLLNSPPAGTPAIVSEVAKRLRSFGGSKALHVSVLRGGMYRDGSWAESPTQPTICLSTVDQIGSRLLFRGYGVSPGQRAVHAGLVGNDSLILLDEAHLSRPFLETLRAVEFFRGKRWAEQPITTPFRVVVMSATAGAAAPPVIPPETAAPEPIRLNEEDHEQRDLRLRLDASKLATLVDVAAADFASRAVEEALRLSEPDAPPKRRGAPSRPGVQPARVIGVVVNRVNTARQIATRLRNAFFERHPELTDSGELVVVLLTGCIRPYDRDTLLSRQVYPIGLDKSETGLLPFVKARANEQRTDYERPPPPLGTLFVVATQTVEVGADFSFDALVTEAAPLDSLRQRFGRLDRLGFRKTSRAVILRNKDAKKEDPVYGSAAAETWKKLKEWEKQAGRSKAVDFGIAALQPLLDPLGAEELASLSAPVACAPVMMPAHVDDLVQTTVPPTPEPDVPLYLHGPSAGPADVSVVWRADLTEELLRYAAQTAAAVVALVPPVSMEALPLPIWTARKWLAGQRLPGFTDLEGEAEPEEDWREARGQPRPFLCWRGPDDEDTTVVFDPDDLRPGDTIVVPSSYGGSDEFGWNPESDRPVTDVADDCSWRAKRRPVLRLHLRSGVHEVALAAWRQFPAAAEVADAIRAGLVTDSETGEPDFDTLAAGLTDLPDPFRWLRPRSHRTEPYPDRAGAGVVFVAKGRPPYPGEPGTADVPVEETEEAPAEGDDASFPDPAETTDGPIPLFAHCAGVRKRVDAFASNLSLSKELSRIASRAALLHDAGKADPRFQLWLYGGNEAVAAKAGFALIAKSGMDARNRAAITAARIRAGWPARARHEAMSVLLLQSTPSAAAGVSDPDLVRYLVGVHHGEGRPLWRLPRDPADDPVDTGAIPTEVRCTLGEIELAAPGRPRPEAAFFPVSAGWADLFWRNVRRYGYWGLAYLEMLLVLADHRQSESEREGGQ